MLIRLHDIPNKELYYNILCQEVDRMGLESLIADITKKRLYEMFFCEE